MKEITNEADAMVCCLYKLFMDRRKDGVSKDAAREFKSDFYKEINALSKFSEADIESTAVELHNAGYIEKDIFGDIVLTDDAVIYMEKRFGLKVDKVIKRIAEITGLIPFL